MYKIEDAWVDEPAMDGIQEPPRLCVQVDELPDVTIPEKKFDQGWYITKTGQFLQYRHETDSVNAGDFNTRFTDVFSPVVDVTVFEGSNSNQAHDKYSLELRRARQLLRRYSPVWRLLLADRDAQSGKIVWLPINKSSTCRYWLAAEKKICGNTPIATIVHVGKVDLPYCTKHVQQHNYERASVRSSRKGA